MLPWRVGLALLFLCSACEPNAPLTTPAPADAGLTCLDFNARYRVSIVFDPVAVIDAGSRDSDAADDSDASTSDGGAGDAGVDAGFDAGKLFPPSNPPAADEPTKRHVRVQLKLGLRDGVNDISLTTVDVRQATSGAPITLLRARANDRVIDLDLDAIAETSFDLLLENAFPCHGRTQTVTLTVTLNDDGSSKASARVPDQRTAEVSTRDRF